MSVERKSIIVGLVTVVALLAIYVTTAWAVEAFDGLSHALAMLSIPLVLFAVAFVWQGTIRLIDPSRPLVTPKYERERMVIGGVNQYVDRHVGQEAGVVSRGGILAFMVIGVLGYAGAIVLLAMTPGAIAKKERKEAEFREQQEAANPFKQLEKAKTVAEALAVVSSSLSDTKDEISYGARLMTTWADASLTWGMVDVADETTVAKIQQDSSSERGKRLCVTGQLVEGGSHPLIEVSPTEYVSAIYNRSHKLYSETQYRFCGIALGRFNRTFTTVGPKVTALVVGVFDPSTIKQPSAEAAPTPTPTPKTK